MKKGFFAPFFIRKFLKIFFVKNETFSSIPEMHRENLFPDFLGIFLYSLPSFYLFSLFYLSGKY